MQRNTALHVETLIRLSRPTIMLIRSRSNEWEWLRNTLDEMAAIRLVADLQVEKDTVEKVASTRPDIVMVPRTRSSETCISLANRIRDQSPLSRIVALGAPVDEEQLLELRDAGVLGYLSWDAINVAVV